MITFMLLLVVFGVLLAIASCGIVAVGAVAGGVLLVALDIMIGLAPFVGVGFLIAWLLKKRG